MHYLLFYRSFLFSSSLYSNVSPVCGPPAERFKSNNEECIYLCGQSLGLQPKGASAYVNDVLKAWATKGVHSHFSGNLPAAHSDQPPREPMARLVGAHASEVAIMNGLTVNLHLLLCTFYRPTQRRYKIMIEEHAFSSDMVRESFSFFFMFIIIIQQTSLSFTLHLSCR